MYDDLPVPSTPITHRVLTGGCLLPLNFVDGERISSFISVSNREYFIPNIDSESILLSVETTAESKSSTQRTPTEPGERVWSLSRASCARVKEDGERGWGEEVIEDM